jgi:hypothetical protein
MTGRAISALLASTVRSLLFSRLLQKSSLKDSVEGIERIITHKKKPCNALYEYF